MKHIYFVVAILFNSTIHSFAQTPGTLDLSFGTNGFIQTKLPLKSDDGISIIKQIKQPDGKYLAVVDQSEYDDSLSIYEEHYYLYRFTSNGQPDPAFGTNGGVALANGPSHLFVLGDGKILLVSNDLTELTTIRLLASGAKDLSYGFKGINYTGYFFYATAAHMQPDGKLILAGNNPAGSKNVLVRINPDGLTDFTFGNNGEQYLPFDNLVDNRSIISIKQMTDGRLLMAAATYFNSANHCIMIRLKSNFTYDSTFSQDGQMTVSYSGFFFGDFDIDGTGRALIAGTYYYNSFQRSALVFARIKANGNQDSTFGTNGIRTTTYGGQRDQITQVKIQPDGKIIAVGSTDLKFAVMRLNTTGTADGSFNTTGKNITPINGSANAGTAYMSMEPDGKLLICGYAFYPDSTMSFMMARYHTGYNVSVDELNTIQNVAAYPNPVADMCEVEYTLQQAGEVTFTLHNLQGKLVQSEVAGEELSAGTHHYQLPLAYLPQGIYVLRICHPNGQATIKLVKQ